MGPAWDQSVPGLLLGQKEEFLLPSAHEGRAPKQLISAAADFTGSMSCPATLFTYLE